MCVNVSVVPASRCAGTSSPECTVLEATAPAHTCQRAPCLSPWAPRPDRRNVRGGGLSGGAVRGTGGEVNTVIVHITTH